MRNFRNSLGIALLAATSACAPALKLSKLADAYNKELMKPYTTTHGVLKSEPPDKYSYRFDVSLTKDDQVNRVEYAVMGHEARLLLTIDDNRTRRLYTYKTNGDIEDCNIFVVDPVSKAPVGQIEFGEEGACKEDAKPFISDFIAALKEYGSRQRK